MKINVMFVNYLEKLIVSVIIFWNREYIELEVLKSGCENRSGRV